MSKASEAANDIRIACGNLGWSFEIRGSIFTIRKVFHPTNEEFVKADMEYGSILELLPRTRSGSDWGTDGGGIGGITAMTTGRFVMNRSGGSKPILKALAND